MATAGLLCASVAVADDGIVAAKVIAVSDRRPVVIVDVGGESGIGQNDRAVIFRDDAVVSTGSVVHLESNRCGVRFGRVGKKIPAVNDRVVVIGSDSSGGKSQSCELALFNRAVVDRVLPAGDRFWIDGGTDGGWQVNDAVVVLRRSTVMGWGRVTNCYENSALVAMDQSREDGFLPARGDNVEIVGRVAPSYSVRTRIAAVMAGSGPTQAILAGDSRTGFSDDDRVEIFRNGKYISSARVVTAETYLQVEIDEAFQRQQPQEGDVAVLRSDADSLEPPVGRIFRVEGDYALITLGQSDGIENGQKLFVLNADGSTTALTVRKVYPEHCGAKLKAPVKRDGQNDREQMRPWGAVSTFAGAASHRTVPCARPIGAGKKSKWLAMFEPEGYCLPKVGDIVANRGSDRAWMAIAVSTEKIVAVEIEAGSP